MSSKKPPTKPASKKQDDQTPADSTTESVDGFDLCPICHLLICRPVTTTCSHTLCESCMYQWSQASRASAEMGLECFPIDYVPPSATHVSAPAPSRRRGPATRSQKNHAGSKLEATCPMCRTQTKATLNEDLEAVLRSQYPRTYAEREREEEAEGELRVQTVEMNIYLGNEHKLEETADGNKHDWTFFVRPDRMDLIEKVKISLHPTFNPPSVVLRRSLFEVRRLGWGTFPVQAEIHLRKGFVWAQNDIEGRRRKDPLVADWDLNFDGGGLQGRLRAEIKAVSRKGDSVAT